MKPLVASSRFYWSFKATLGASKGCLQPGSQLKIHGHRSLSKVQPPCVPGKRISGTILMCQVPQTLTDVYFYQNSSPTNKNSCKIPMEMPFSSCHTSTSQHGTWHLGKASLHVKQQQLYIKKNATDYTHFSGKHSQSLLVFLMENSKFPLCASPFNIC